MNVLMTVLVIQGRVNYRNLGRHGQYHERTYRRWFREEFDFASFNLACLAQRKTKGQLVAALDASYIPKSGKHTDGVGNFYDGCVGKVRKGLEISSMALIDRESRQAFSFDSQQTLDSDLRSEESRVHGYAKHVVRCASKLPEEVEYLVVDGYYAKKTFLTLYVPPQHCMLLVNCVVMLMCIISISTIQMNLGVEDVLSSMMAKSISLLLT